MRHIVVLALGLVGLLLLVGQFLSPVHPLSGPTAAVVIASEAPAPLSTRPVGEGLVIERDQSGQFHVDAAVNGAQTSQAEKPGRLGVHTPLMPPRACKPARWPHLPGFVASRLATARMP